MIFSHISLQIKMYLEQKEKAKWKLESGKGSERERDVISFLKNCVALSRGLQ
jgi:hypothetical protein